MRRQPPYQSSPAQPGEVVPTSVRRSRAEPGDQAVLLDRSTDGAELEIRPIATSRGARWTRAESLLGLGLVAVLFGGALVNAIASAVPQPTPSASSIVATVDCTPIRDSTTPVRARLRPVGATGGATGRIGKTTDRDLARPDDWQLPTPNDGIEIGFGTPLEATSDGVCVVGWSVWVVSTIDVLAEAESSMVKLGSGAFEPTAASVPVPGPTADGDWTLRLATAYQTETGKTRWNAKFFRVVVGGAPYETPVPPTPRVTVAPTPAITPAVACGALAEDDAPPVVNLVAPGLDPIPGTLGAFTWFGAVSPPSTVRLEEGGAIPFEGDIEIQLGEICATRWTIVSSPAGSESSLQEVSFTNNGQSDWGSFTSNRADNPIISQQNRITARTVGLGRVFVRALLNFEGGQQAQVYWLVRIKAFEAPAIHVFGPDGTDVTPVVGCGASVQMNDGNWFGEECPSGSWPLLEDGPIITAHEGDIVRVEIPDWPLTYWGVRWVDQAEVRPGISDPNDLGNFYGYDSLKHTMFRWFVPPAGDYGVQISLTYEQDLRTYNLPVHIRLRVLP